MVSIMINRRALDKIWLKNGTCLGIAPEKNGKQKLHVRCGNGHEWCPSVDNLIYSDSWCPDCYGNRPLTIDLLNDIAHNRGGKLLSTEYAGGGGLLVWECADGHTWKASPKNIKNKKSWCPHCNCNVGEEMVRATFEEAFPDKLFDRTRRVPELEGLELDGYNDELRLAFEYQGIQHYQQVPHFHRNPDDFESQKERDRLTFARCAYAEITLILIPYKISACHLRNYVRNELELLGYSISPKIGTDAEFYDRVRASGDRAAHKFKKITEIIESKGGVCLSTKYAGYKVPLRIRCRYGHEFDASPEAISQPPSRGPRFCVVCGGTSRKTDEALSAAVAECGYTFISVESKMMAGRSRRYIKITCPAGHTYDTLWDNFKPIAGIPKKGCSSCFHSRLGESKRCDYAASAKKLGFTLSPGSVYTSNIKPVSWICEAGHTIIDTLKGLQDKKSPCYDCRIIKYSGMFSIELVKIEDEELTWKCIKCDSTFSCRRHALYYDECRFKNCSC